MKQSESHKESQEKVSSSIGSILISVLLVLLAMGFVFSFKHILNFSAQRGSGDSGMAGEGSSSTEEVNIEKDQNFIYEYIMIQGLDGKELKAVKNPEKKADPKTNPSVSLEEGQILKVNMRGYIGGKLYYQLENNYYVKDSRAIMPLKEYVKVSGHLAITYMSSSGVRLRKWADFDADNVVGSVYVGDKVNVVAKVITIKDTEAYVTTDGYYITTESRYLNDHTKMVDDPALYKDKESGEGESSKEESSEGVTSGQKEESSEEASQEGESSEDKESEGENSSQNKKSEEEETSEEKSSEDKEP